MIWAPAFRPKTGFQLWLEENRKSIAAAAAQPDLEETDVIKEAMGRFRMLSAEERLVPRARRPLGSESSAPSAEGLLSRRRVRLLLQLSVGEAALPPSEG